MFAGDDDSGRSMLPPRFIEFIARQDVEALSKIWNALVDGTEQLQSELMASSPADRVLVDPDNVDLFLKSEDRRTGVVRVGPVSLEEIFEAAHAPTVQYGLAMSGVWMLLWYLARHFNECVARRLYFVPSLVAWTRQWEGRDPGVVDFRAFLASTPAWRGLNGRAPD